MQKTRDGGSWSKIRPTGYYTATVQRENYRTESFTVVVVGGNFGGPYFVADFQMLPQVPMTNDDIRVVLRGGRFNVLMQCSPCLQLVVTGPTEGGQELARMEPALSKTNNDSHIFNDFAGLIVQRTVIRKQLTGSYEIMVYDWETRHNLNSSAMKDSNAVVQIYRGNDLWEQFYVPNRDGNTWTVASITGSNVTVINEVTSMIHPTDWEPEHSTLAECAPLSSECENTLGCCGDLTCSNGICAGTPTQAGLEEAPNALDMRTRILAICSDSCEDKLDQPDYYECCRIFMKTKTRLQRI
ncbi:uncharacterized protein LOC129601970 [Paramacrobiotus metropolitanus]|uniref:uncharacterized protein LOC129601970 n=1 Tax=Paramacrobiotus metropolitanus TaxID=2943436 RepID=UPI00244612AD|nr:uncharacterized protein LOC129601970 [Paramacrobiotus metropolitanus]